ncbi:hypothetical protein ACFVJ8_25665 [Streptomyces yangpuensis]|uniref:hypothetical protein n=1 Tax=Streptomyces yangpuensis TaxID=1648182 RepID=UPI0036356488
MGLYKGFGPAMAATAAAVAMVSPASAATQQAPTAVASETAAVCGVTPRHRDFSEYKQHFTQNVYLRNGPAWGCDILNSASVTSKVDYWCSADGFTYLRTESRKYGWVSNLYLRDGGSAMPC